MPTDLRDIRSISSSASTRAASASVAWMYGLTLLIALALCVLGGINGELAVVGAGLLGVVIVGATAPIAYLLLRPMSVPPPATSNDESFKRLALAIEELAEEQALSDDARRVLHRKRERDLLRRAIEEDIAVEDWDAAMVLVKELAERFGYRADAEEFRARIDDARLHTTERKVSDAIVALDRMVAEHRWAEASSEAARLTRLYPESHLVEGLRHRVEAARDRYKQELERKFLNAASDGRVEDAMSLLSEMDAYLTEAEAAPLKEVARGVIGQARENLGVRFKLAVQDKRWREAAEVGERIVVQFPNSRMAAEVRDVIDGIRQRAAALQH